MFFFLVAPTLTMLKHFKADTITIRKGQPIDIPAEVTGLPLPTIEWFKDDVLISEPLPETSEPPPETSEPPPEASEPPPETPEPPPKTFVIDTVEVNRLTATTKLSIPVIARKDKGYYTVSASNRLGTVTHNVLVFVLGMSCYLTCETFD